MENKDLRIDKRIVWVLIIGNLLLTVLGAMAKIYHYEVSDFLLIFVSAMIFSAWVILMSDMVKNQIHKKSFWILSMFILPTIAPIFYLIQRKRLIHLSKSFKS